MGKIYCILGQTGSGKSSIEVVLSRAIKQFGNIETLPTYTSRPMRDYEEQGNPYQFISKYDFLLHKTHNKFAEWAGYTTAEGDTWYYGTLIEDVNPTKNYLKVINPYGFKQLRNIFGKNRVIGIYITAQDKVRLKRTIDREEDPNCDELCRRFISDKADFAEIDNMVDIVIDNSYDIEKSISLVEQYIRRDIEGRETNENNF